MNSTLYRCLVMHDRLSPKRHRFDYDLFMWSLDVDELDSLAGRLWLMSRNRWNMFSFWDKDHLPCTGGNVKANVIKYLRECGVRDEIFRVQLVTHLRTMGHLFNPVSFFFCFGAQNQPICAVAEVGNTFGEMKPFLLGPDKLSGARFVDRQTKYFYVSPFLNHDMDFDFLLAVPGEKLELVINTTQGGKPVLIATLTGQRVPLTNHRLLGYALRFPFITLKVLGLIEWQAFKLWLKKLPYWKKSEHPELQRGMYARNTR